MLGYPDQAQQRSYEALALARELSHPYDVVFALNQAVVLHQLRREGCLAYERAEESLTFCTEQEFTQQLAMPAPTASSLVRLDLRHWVYLALRLAR